MEISVLRRKLQVDLEFADDELLKKINALIVNFKYQRKPDLLIEGADKDIREGRVYSIDEF